MRTYSGLSSTTPAGTWTSSPCCQHAALCAANFSLVPTSEPSSGWSSVSGSKRIPSGASSIVIPASVSHARPATSRSSIDSTVTSCAPFGSAVQTSGSNPSRSVNRQCSSCFVGNGSAR